jgi:transcriptional regulator with XRE-family HTH domain
MKEYTWRRLKFYRERLKMSQSAAARASGLGQSDISRLEAGKMRFIPPEYLHFLHSYGCDLNYLFAEEGSGYLKHPGQSEVAEPGDASEPAWTAPKPELYTGQLQGTGGRVLRVELRIQPPGSSAAAPEDEVG